MIKLSQLNHANYKLQFPLNLSDLIFTKNARTSYKLQCCVGLKITEKY